MPDETKIEDVQNQLQLYCDWLKDRSEVGLSNDTGSTTKPNSSPKQSRPMLALVSGVVVVVAGVGLVMATDRGAQDDLITVASEETSFDAAENTLGEQTEPTSDTEAAMNDHDQAGDDNERTGDKRTDDNATLAPVDQANSRTTTVSEPLEETADTETKPEAQETITTETEPEAEETTTPSTTEPPADSDDSSSSNSTTMRFLSPSNGSTIDMNLGAKVRVGPMNDASSYTFTVSQDGKTVMEQTASEPVLIVPGQLTALANGLKYKAGVMTITAKAHDAAGSELGTGSVQVIMRSGGSPPRFGSTSLPGSLPGSTPGLAPRTSTP